MKLLLHICCAPCLIEPHQALKDKFSLTGFFYNPNIHPEGEFNNRFMALRNYTKDIKLETIYPIFDTQEFFDNIENNLDKPKRCQLCWRMRLEKTAFYARVNNFEYFSTTLLVSRYQDHELLREIAEEVSNKVNIKFYYQDFRPKFKEAYNKAKIKGLYLQKYCGCIYSNEEKNQKKCN
ncbi:MAG: epoxyqueuosine reductase QueH [Candidatus Omnitrophota bacterium]